MKRVISVVAALMLVACGQKNEDAHLVTKVAAARPVINLNEVCYDGYVYLVSEGGGLAPKIRNEWNGTAGIAAVGIKCGVEK
jgi:hypothetical protein